MEIQLPAFQQIFNYYFCLYLFIYFKRSITNLTTITKKEDRTNERPLHWFKKMMYINRN
jgi:hypothetical protein